MKILNSWRKNEKGLSSRTDKENTAVFYSFDNSNFYSLEVDVKTESEFAGFLFLVFLFAFLIWFVEIGIPRMVEDAYRDTIVDLRR